MELFKEILVETLSKGEVNVTFSNLTINATEIIERESLKALQKIKAVIEDDRLTDFDCIEEIVRIFEEMGSDGGGRHNFG